jgi:hypothetical protein
MKYLKTIAVSEDPDEIDYYQKFENWERATKHLHTTIQRIRDIPIGETRNFLCLDRNVLDLAGNELSKYKAGDEAIPSDVFNNNYHIKFTKTDKGITGKFYIVNSREELNEPDDSSNERNDFDIEYLNDRWYPMENGILPASGDQGFSRLLGIKKKWTTFPLTTRLGWRGPMIPLERIDEIKIQF